MDPVHISLRYFVARPLELLSSGTLSPPGVLPFEVFFPPLHPGDRGAGEDERVFTFVFTLASLSQVVFDTA